MQRHENDDVASFEAVLEEAEMRRKSSSSVTINAAVRPEIQNLERMGAKSSRGQKVRILHANCEEHGRISIRQIVLLGDFMRAGKSVIARRWTGRAPWLRLVIFSSTGPVTAEIVRAIEKTGPVHRFLPIRPTVEMKIRQS